MNNHWISLKYPLAPSEENKETFQQLIVGSNILLLGCTKILLPLATEAVDTVVRYDNPKIRIGDWLQVNQRYDSVLADGCLNLGFANELIEHFSSRSTRFIARSFTKRHPDMKVANQFFTALDFDITPIVFSESEWYRFYVWDFE